MSSIDKTTNQIIGIHVLAATKYGKSDQAKLLRAKIADSTFDFGEVDVLMAGYLHKKGSWNSNWNRRYFTLRNDNCLYYFENAHDTFKYKGIIPLNSVYRLTMTTTADSKFSFGFALETKSRTYFLACVGDTERTDWMSTIACLRTSPSQVERHVPSTALSTLQQNRDETDNPLSIAKVDRKDSIRKRRYSDGSFSKKNEQLGHDASSSHHHNRPQDYDRENSWQNGKNSLQKNFLSWLKVDDGQSHK
ncbi:hypothetical protein RFI_00837 [Reticulomyxa filosa]|uniref:PH domain-containing protein n=1 Tax=Reticulomyxa filosa TaxID=46433 RepID=X6PCG7_RETFI|nr:hypothetical protein RFI_00837 [Reticulomyxa filosa]|eukprot:ETO36225.1 hypothetical protein RFI_00837 [Reticulomyxa filosa]